MDQHRNPKYRAKFPSVHYDALTCSSHEDVYILAIVPDNERDAKSEHFQNTLNVMEMLCCLLFQTLSTNMLVEFLPQNMIFPVTVQPINIASPLDHSTTNRYGSAIYQLRDSTGPIHIEAIARRDAVNIKNLEKAHAVQLEAKLAGKKFSRPTRIGVRRNISDKSQDSMLKGPAEAKAAERVKLREDLKTNGVERTVKTTTWASHTSSRTEKILSR